MKKALQYLKFTLSTLVLLAGTEISCYGSSISNIISSNLGEQTQGLQLTHSPPEPEAMLLLGVGLLLLAAVSKKGNKDSSKPQ